MWGFSCVCYCSEPGFEHYLRTAEGKLSYTCNILAELVAIRRNSNILWQDKIYLYPNIKKKIKN